jgi:multidrug resistance efflux pump
VSDVDWDIQDYHDALRRARYQLAQAEADLAAARAALERYKEVVACARVQYDVYGAYDDLRKALDALAETKP